MVDGTRKLKIAFGDLMAAQSEFSAALHRPAGARMGNGDTSSETVQTLADADPGDRLGAYAPPAGLEPATLRLTAECSAS